MEKVLYFDYSAFVIYAVILFSIGYRKMTQGLANKMFIWMVVFMLFTTIFDYGMEAISALATTGGQTLSPELINLDYFFSYGYFLTRNANNAFYVLFIFAITRTWYALKRPAVKALVIAPYALLVILLASNFYHHMLFTVTENGYERGKLIYILYIMSFIYVGMCFSYLLYCKRFLDKRKWLALMLLYVFAIIAVSVQFFVPQLLIEMFSMAIGCLIIILHVHIPEEIVDESLGLLSFDAYRSELQKVLLTRKMMKLVVIKFVNAYEVRAYLEEEKYNTYIQRIVKRLNVICKKYAPDYTLFYEQTGCIYIMFDDERFDPARDISIMYNEFMDNIKDVINSGTRLKPSICYLRIPDDIGNFNEIIKFGHRFYDHMPKDKIYASANELLNTRNFQMERDMDSILTRAMMEHNLYMYYQPIYNVRKRYFTAVEALIRLKDPKYGFVPPEMFVPNAEKSGIMLTIGNFVVKEVFKFIFDNKLTEKGVNDVCINLSTAQAIQSDFANKIISLQEKYHIQPAGITFEITEELYKKTKGVADSNFTELGDRGYSFVLDDYGSSYSDISGLATLPVRTVKLDERLVKAISTQKGRTIVAGTIRTLKDLGFEVVAEGVETREQFDYLCDCRCDYIQGYYFSEALTAKEYIEFVKDNNRLKL